MTISKHNANAIVEALREVIDKDINIMDSEGVIIASTNAARIGQFHEAASRIIKGNLDELVVTSGQEFKGAREGINLPIRINGEVIGVIGITGKPEEITVFSRIIKKMTEVMVLDLMRNEEEHLKESAKAFFVQEWLFSPPVADPEPFILRGRLLDIDVTVPRFVAVIKILNEGRGGDDKDAFQPGRVLSDIRGRLNCKPGGDVSVMIGSEIIVLFADKSVELAKNKAMGIKYAIESLHPAKVYGGISSVCENYADLGRCFRNAQTACNVSVNNKSKEFTLYQDLSIEMMLASLPARMKSEFLDRIFGGCTAYQIEEWMRLLHVFFENDGSISKSAEQMFMHKNTYQYKLNRLRDKLGYDPRNRKDALTLYFAMLLYGETKRED